MLVYLEYKSENRPEMCSQGERKGETVFKFHLESSHSRPFTVIEEKTCGVSKAKYQLLLLQASWHAILV
jgi:hypothetical protein